MKEFDFKGFLKHQENYYLLYIIFLFCYVTYYLVQWPIFAGDSDLWYHLNGGRYILEHGTIPKDSSFFSFVEPPREWVNYYWLFQVLVYKIYSFSGYYGLVFLRAVVFLLLMAFIFIYFFKKTSRISLCTTLLFSFYLIALLPRYHLVRPHMFSYLFIIIFLYVIECRREKTIFLPFIAILWINIHGIEYPVMILIVLTYLLKETVKRFKSKVQFKRKEINFIISLLFCIVSVYISPHGTKLTSVPFTPTDFASLYINELKLLRFNEIISYNITDLSLSVPTVFNLLLLIGFFSVISSYFIKSINLSHILLFAGGLFLLSKARRFNIEYMLLSLPVIASCVLKFPSLKIGMKELKPVASLFIIMILFVPLHTITKMFGIMPKYPFSHKNLPYGSTEFLNKIGVGGTILNNPNYGGYMQWALYPKYKIYMDMEVPFLFTNEDIYFIGNVFSNYNFLKNAIDNYHPDFITNSIYNSKFKDLIKSFPQYKVVFFDEITILYADINKHPEIGKKYVLNYLDPYNFINIDVKKFLESAEAFQELLTLLDIFPKCGLKNQLLAIAYNKKGDYGLAIAYADRLITFFPDASIGYKLKADALKNMNMNDRAIKEYKKALERTHNKVDIYKEIANIYMNQKKYDKAYKTFKIFTDPFAETDYKSMYDICLAAVMSDNIKDAGILFRYAYPLVPPEDKEWEQKYAELEKMIKKHR